MTANELYAQANQVAGLAIVYTWCGLTAAADLCWQLSSALRAEAARYEVAS